jgi:hypothetical protein
MTVMVMILVAITGTSTMPPVVITDMPLTNFGSLP